jgi:hypothetical protein
VTISDNTNADGVSTAASRADHVHAHGSRGGGTLHAFFTMASALAGFVGTPSIAHPARSLNTTFQPSATRPVLGIYSVRIVSSSTLVGGQIGRVELRCDAGSPPTTVQDRIAGGSSGTLLVGLNIVDTSEAVLFFLIPEGFNVNLTTVNELGTPTFTLTNVTEITL